MRIWTLFQEFLQFIILILSYLSLSLQSPPLPPLSANFLWTFSQNFFKDAWNVFDFITVIGSIIDAMVLEIGVRTYNALYIFQWDLLNDWQSLIVLCEFINGDSSTITDSWIFDCFQFLYETRNYFLCTWTTRSANVPYQIDTLSILLLEIY